MSKGLKIVLLSAGILLLGGLLVIVLLFGWMVPRFSGRMSVDRFARVGDDYTRMGRGWMWSDDAPDGVALDLETVHETVDRYLDDEGWNDTLIIEEIMIFDNHAYVELYEIDSGYGAMEWIVDEDTLKIRPEMGPNMMWNLKYGHMRGGMMGGYRGYRSFDPAEMPVSTADAVRLAQDYLNDEGSGLFADDHASVFYGYYTLHVLDADGGITGMLSVNGFDGDVFYHTWHGEFIEMSEGHGD
ncbi:MAG: hypothetical protein JW750_01095 [Anaerolineaceae bacterium]|nr:hypothetical protein [Anaerolineaceae bacterium]